MAGEGTRFKGYQDVPKPLINIHNKKMIEWCIASYPFINYLNVKWRDVIFICRKQHETDYGIKNILHNAFSDEIRIEYIDKTTGGPVESALYADTFMNEKYEDVIISDCDMFFNGFSLLNKIIKKSDSVKGILPVCNTGDTNPSWSYIELKNNKIVSVKEKDPILAKNGAPGIIGAYYFSNWIDFYVEAKKMILENDTTGFDDKPEYYLSKIYDRFIARGYLIDYVFIDMFWILGTPRQIKKLYKDTQNII